jgi:peroxiredoxin
MKRLPRIFRPLRLVAGLVVMGLLMVPAYFLVIREPADANVRRAVVLDTASDDGLDVGLDLGEKAPDFEFSTPEGERVRLSDFEGRALVVNFWATWCTSCLTEMPDLKALQEELGRDTFSVLAVNAGETRPRAEEFIDFLQAPFVFAMDPGLVITDAYGIYGLPLSVFLDSNGVVRGVYRGHANPEVLNTYVTAAIEAEPPGEIPVILRTVSTIYRPRLLIVSTAGPGNLTFASKALRCDFSYCAEEALTDGLAGSDGIIRTVFSENPEGDRQLTVDFDAMAISDDDVVIAVRQLLEGLDDPVYDLPIEIEFRAN